MQRRLVCSGATRSVAAASRHFDFLSANTTRCKRYLYSSSGSGPVDSDGRDGQLHHFIRDYTHQQQQQQHDQDTPRHGQAVQEPLSHRAPSAPRAGPFPGVAAGEGEDGPSWKSQLYRELLVETDPLGGMAHKDYYRDPAEGYAPQYAPRNFAQGGELDYRRMSSPAGYAASEGRRAWLQHDVDDLAQRAQQARASLRAHGGVTGPPDAPPVAPAGVHSVSWMQRHVYPSPAAPHWNHRHGGAGGPRRADIAHVDALCSSAAIDVLSQLHHHSGATPADQPRRRATVSRFQAMTLCAPASESTDTLPADELQEHIHRQLAARRDDGLAEDLRIAHGLRARERHEFTVMQRTARRPFAGYDMDRFAAQQRGSPYGALQLPPATPACTIAEAQATIRSPHPSPARGEPPTTTTTTTAGASAAAAALRESVAKETYARNTVSDSPQLDGALTESIVAQLTNARRSHAAQHAHRRRQRFGLGRQGGGLVHDGGPDQRTLSKHRNDARLVDALHFSSDAYRHHRSDEHVNPYIRRDTAHGVGHLILNHFDLCRRVDRLARRLPDVTERQTIHYGVPVAQGTDEFVLRHRNARGERPLDYFKPFPHFRAQRLERVYEDVEGFALLRHKPDTLVWELFMRYRAHHHQRRALALLHGLEPVSNETAGERAARRGALDALCERVPFDAATFLVAQDDETVVAAETLRGWFGVYMLPSPSVVAALVGDEGDKGNESIGAAAAAGGATASRDARADGQGANRDRTDAMHAGHGTDDSSSSSSSSSSRRRHSHGDGNKRRSADEDGTVQDGGHGHSRRNAATAVNIHLHHVRDELGTLDTREHVLSARYLNKLFAFEGYQQRVHRHHVHDTLGRAPEPVIRYAQPASALRQFSAEERAMYERYVASETHAQLARWARRQRGRRWVRQRGEYGVVVRQGAAMRVVDAVEAESGAVVSVCATRYAQEMAAAWERQRRVVEHEDEQQQQQQQQQQQTQHNQTRPNDAPLPSSAARSLSSVSAKRTRDHVRRLPPCARMSLDRAEEDGGGTVEYVLLAGTERTVVPLSIRLDSGEWMDMTAEDFSRCPLEEPASSGYNHALDYGVADYSYNRANYVETQDVLWERATAAGTEGWSPATHADGLRPGLPVRARRAVASVCLSTLHGAVCDDSSHTAETTRRKGAITGRDAEMRGGSVTSGGCGVDHTGEDHRAGRMRMGGSGCCSTAATSARWGICGREASDALVTGEYQRGYLVRYDTQPFYNPEPRVVWVCFARDGAVEQVPLSDVLIWQRRYHGPERTVADTTRRFNRAGLRRYIDVADPCGEKSRCQTGDANTTATRQTHFLDKYDTQRGARDVAAVPDMSTVKQSDEIDRWTVHDSRRADNHRPLSISHRRDYVRQNYLPRYTPWEWIAIQEADQPVIAETIRRDDTGPSYFFSLNRYWRYKARPHGYVRHFEHEVRDLMQYVDGITPWRQAQKIRTYWEVREHHPMPQFNRPEVAMHRNTPALLPSHLWETDKKTAKVKAVKDSVRDYQTKTPVPKWVQL